MCLVPGAISVRMQAERDGNGNLLYFRRHNYTLMVTAMDEEGASGSTEVFVTLVPYNVAPSLPTVTYMVEESVGEYTSTVDTILSGMVNRADRKALRGVDSDPVAAVFSSVKSISVSETHADRLTFSIVSPAEHPFLMNNCAGGVYRDILCCFSC